MKLHEVDLCGQHLYLCLNGQALFDIYDKFGTKGFITDPLKDSGKKSFEAVCYYLFKLSEQGELYRRWQGQTHGPVLTEQFFRVNLAPHEVAAAKDAILAAITTVSAVGSTIRHKQLSSEAYMTIAALT